MHTISELLHVQNDCNQTVVRKGSIFVDNYAAFKASRMPCIDVLVVVCSELQTAYVTKYRDVTEIYFAGMSRNCTHTHVHASGTSAGFLLCLNA